MKDSEVSFEELQERLRQFRREREWDQFHTPRNLILALMGEIGELASLVQWVPDGDLEVWLGDPKNLNDLKEEIADVLAYILQLSDAVGVQPLDALEAKIELNRLHYPIALSRGSSAKYSSFDGRDTANEQQ